MRHDDPKGYYEALGLAPGAGSEEVKAAYRRLAERLHPDAVGGDGAAFARISEAYRVLGDPARRLEYDAGAHKDARPLPCQRCGRISAQPHFVTFDEVRAFLRRVQRRRIGGVLCHGCAEHVALQASAVTWLCGWWAPRGPVAALRALYANFRGGTMPAAENLSLLLKQARGFRDSGQAVLARAVLEQADAFADGRGRNAIEVLAASLPEPTLRLKDRWRRPGWMRLLHLLSPTALLLGAAAAVGIG